MKYCPICDERYDEDIIRFCTNDGTPLVEEDTPNFTALPSENIEGSEDDFGEATVIRRKPLESNVETGSTVPPEQPERIVIPTTSAAEQQVRPRTAPAYNQPLPSNTGKTVALTILGTLLVLGFGAILFWFLQKETPSNSNTNLNLNSNFVNQNANLNTNLGFDANFNFNTSNTNANYNTNFNVATNVNTNRRTPTPTPKPSPSSSPTPTPSPSSTVKPPTNINRPPANAGPTPLTTPRMGPRPPLMTNRPPGNGE